MSTNPNDASARRRKILFTDWRDIDCGSVAWLTAAGERYRVGNPPGEPVALWAEQPSVPRGIRLQAQAARKAGMIEGTPDVGHVLYEEGRYRSWYLEVNGISRFGTGAPAHRRPPELVEICSVESPDGLHWSAPTRSRIEAPARRDFDGMGFFIDPHASPDERYKFIYCAKFDEGAFRSHLDAYLRREPRHRDARISAERRYGMFAAVSPDGVTWRSLPEPFTLHPSDTDTTVFWDDAVGVYVMYTRLFRDGRRWIGRAEARDFAHWGPVEPIIWPRLDDPPDYDYYLNGHSRYPGAPEYRLMLPMLYHRYTERSHVRLYSSADGIAWSEVPGGPVLTTGEPGAWDSEFIGTGKDLVPFGEGRIAIPYSGTGYPHKYPRWQPVFDAMRTGWAWWPQDRLCAVVADYEGEFHTPPILPAGRRMRLDFRTPMAGRVRIGIDGVERRSAADCDPLVGDHAGRPVTWGGEADLGVPADRPISLHVSLRSAELFSITFE
jgi:hypothetical protein